MKGLAFCVIGALLGAGLMQVLMQSGVVTRPGGASPIAADESSPAPRDAGQQISRRDSATEASATQPAAVAASVGRTRPGPGAEAEALLAVANDDPALAMERALALDAYWLRLDTVERVASVWASQSPEDALTFVRASPELDPDAKSSVRARILEAWAAADPGQALGYLLSQQGQDLFFYDRSTADRLADEISTHQPYAVLAAADTLPAGVIRNQLRDAAIPKLVETDIAFALQQAALAAPGPDKRRWVSHIQGALVRTDPEGALDWARRIDAQVPGTLRTVTRLVQENYP